MGSGSELANFRSLVELFGASLFSELEEVFGTIKLSEVEGALELGNFRS